MTKSVEAEKKSVDEAFESWKFLQQNKQSECDVTRNCTTSTFSKSKGKVPSTA